jgi:hypothetical protein
LRKKLAAELVENVIGVVGLWQQVTEATYYVLSWEALGLFSLTV